MVLNPEAFKSYCIYQIYPASFCDSNADGFGDLRGIQSKLDHVQSLGADVIWLSPIYASPLNDMGYDISDYQAIDARYGTLQDWDGLLKDVHSRGMKLVMDLVVNHTSDQHEWFKESRKSKSSSKRDWYIWRPAKYNLNGTRWPPNNWSSIAGGSAWEWDEETQEYYLHLFVKEQPDLNWENPEVRQAVWSLMRWWMDRGCDGFRMDMINTISKVAGLPDAEITYPNSDIQPAFKLFANGPRVHEYLQEMHREVLTRYPGYFTVGETPFTHDASELIKYVLPERKELQIVFQFELAELDGRPDHPDKPLMARVPSLPEIKAVVNKWQAYMFANGGWNSLYFESHDQARVVSRLLGFGARNGEFDFDLYRQDLDKYWSMGAKLLAILQATQGGTVFVYQGQEIGSVNVPREWGIEEYKDICTINFYKEELEKRRKVGDANPDMSEVMDGINRKARDNARVPVQWDDSPHAGFTTGTPWMRVHDNYTAINVKRQTGDESSVLSFWKSMIQLRKDYPVLVHGDFSLLSEQDDQIFAYTRSHNDASMFVAMNYSRDTISYTLPEGIHRGDPKLVGGNKPHEHIELGEMIELEAYEGQIWAL